MDGSIRQSLFSKNMKLVHLSNNAICFLFFRMHPVPHRAETFRIPVRLDMPFQHTVDIPLTE